MSAIAAAVALAVSTATNAGVVLDAYAAEDVIWLSSIERTDGAPGAGADAIRLLMDIAEEHDVPLRGAIVHDHEPLTEYYASLGFELVDSAHEHGRRRVVIEFLP